MIHKKINKTQEIPKEFIQKIWRLLTKNTRNSLIRFNFSVVSRYSQGLPKIPNCSQWILYAFFWIPIVFSVSYISEEFAGILITFWSLLRYFNNSLMIFKNSYPNIKKLGIVKNCHCYLRSSKDVSRIFKNFQRIPRNPGNSCRFRNSPIFYTTLMKQ